MGKRWSVSTRTTPWMAVEEVMAGGDRDVLRSTLMEPCPTEMR